MFTISWKSIQESLDAIKLGSISLLTVINAAFLFIICLIVIAILMKVIERVLERSKLELTLKRFFHSIIKVVLWIIAAIVIVGKLGIPTTPFVAVLSVVGLALSLSIQGVLTNLFSSFTIMSTKPFAAGDYVEIGGETGTITEVGLFYTTMKTVDNKVVYTPNGEVTATKIINYTKEGVRRLDLNFEASYDDSTESVKKAIMEAVNEDERILKEPAPFVGLLEFKDSSIQYAMRVWVKSSNYLDVLFSINERVRDRFAANGVQMTYSHLNVHMIDD